MSWYLFSLPFFCTTCVVDFCSFMQETHKFPKDLYLQHYVEKLRGPDNKYNRIQRIRKFKRLIFYTSFAQTTFLLKLIWWQANNDDIFQVIIYYLLNIS
jgi:hypothetical protein